MRAEGLEVYTDGSKDDEGKLGIGIHIPQWNLSRNHALSEDVSVFTAEMVAVLKALELLACKPPLKATIFTDSLSTVYALMRPGECSRPDIAEEILHAATIIHHEGCKVTLAWIPAHIGITGNEAADKQANRGRSSKSKINTGLGVAEVKSIVKETINNQWREQWQTSIHGRFSYSLFQQPDRKPQVKENLKIPMNRKLLKLQVGRGRFLIDNPFCDPCKEHNSIAHIFECQRYGYERTDLELHCKGNNTSVNAATLLNNQLPKDTKKLVKQYLCRIDPDLHI